MFDAMLSSAGRPLTATNIYLLEQGRAEFRWSVRRVSPSRDMRVPEVCKYQDDSVGCSQSPFGYAVRSINDRSCSRKEGGTSRFRIVSSRLLEMLAETRAIQHTI
jgi:hypothetical protein